MIDFESFVKQAGDAASSAVRGFENVRSRCNTDHSLRWTIRGDFTQFWNRGDEPDTRFADSSHHIDFSLSLFDIGLLAAGFILLSALSRLFSR